MTQNIDRLHSKAGSERVIEVHGSIATSSCTTCRTSYPLENVGELFDTALAWARKLAAQAPVAVEQLKRASDDPDLDQGIEKEKAGFATAFRSEDGKEGISAFLAKRTPKWQGK